MSPMSGLVKGAMVAAMLAALALGAALVFQGASPAGVAPPTPPRALADAPAPLDPRVLEAPEPAEATAEPLHPDDADTRPVKLSGDPPDYTEMARRARIQGVVVLEVVVDEDGRVGEARVLKSLPLGLDRSALDAVGAWRFRPATRNGEPVAVYQILTLTFRLP